MLTTGYRRVRISYPPSKSVAQADSLQKSKATGQRHGSSHELRERPGVRARAEGSLGAIRGHQLLRTDLLHTTAGEQMARVVDLCQPVDPAFVAPLAIFSRTQSFMNDMPA